MPEFNVRPVNNPMIYELMEMVINLPQFGKPFIMHYFDVETGFVYGDLVVGYNQEETTREFEDDAEVKKVFEGNDKDCAGVSYTEKIRPDTGGLMLSHSYTAHWEKLPIAEPTTVQLAVHVETGLCYFYSSRKVNGKKGSLKLVQVLAALVSHQVEGELMWQGFKAAGLNTTSEYQILVNYNGGVQFVDANRQHVNLVRAISSLVGEELTAV